MSTEHGGWKCFSCEESGSITTFLYKVGRLTRKQVDRAVGTLRVAPRLSDRAKRKMDVKEEWTVLPEYILGAYDHTPQSLIDQGFSPEILQAHDVGIDRRNDRITFPVRDVLGRLVAISGRASNDWQIPRYKVYDAVSPSSTRKAGELYGVVDRYIPHNRDHLYGLHTVYPERFFEPDKEHSPLIITEGYKSTLHLRQVGFTHAVGLQGSSLTAMQLRALTKMRGPYYLMLDNEPGKAYPDRKGRCAAVHILRQLRRSGRAFLCMYDEERPVRTAPDDIKDPQELHYMIQHAMTLGQIATSFR